jgi:hypothetical protein
MTKMINLSIVFILYLNLHANQATPFEIVGNLVIVYAMVDDKPGNYIIDTGVPIVILNADYFQGKKSEKVMQGINGEGGLVFTRYSNIEIGPNKWKSVYTEITSLEAIERALRRPIHGLIGCQLFRNNIVVFDYEKKEIRISSAKNSERSEVKSRPSSSISYRFKGHIPVISASVGAIDLNLIVDTGSALNILGKNDLDNLGSKLIEWDKQSLAGLGTKAVKAETGTVFDLEIGSIKCDPMKTLFSLDTHVQALCPGRSVDGVLGYEYLKQFCMTINFKDRIISFDPTENFNDLDLAEKQ